MPTKTNTLRIAFAVAIVIALAVFTMSQSKPKRTWGNSDPGEVGPVLVANQYLSAYTVIKASMVLVQEFPKRLTPPGALRSTAELENDAKQNLFMSALAIPEGQPLTRALLVDAAQSDTLGALIRPGKVAVSFDIDKAHGVGGWIRPGDTVALFSSGKKTTLLNPSILVVAVDDKRLGQQRPDVQDDNNPEARLLKTAHEGGNKTLTVLVGPQEAARIIEAREGGNLSVVLRSLGDDLPWPQVQ